MEKQKVAFVDNLRLISTIAVIVQHTSSVSYSSFCVDKTSFGGWLLSFIWVICRFAVPVFVMTTGYLLLQPSKSVDYTKVFNKYCLRIVIILLTIGMAYAWLEIIFAQKEISIIQFKESLINVLQGNLWDHMWYLYMLIGLYIVIPQIKAFVVNISLHELDVFIGISVFFSVIMHFINVWTGFELGVKPAVGLWGLYLILGYRVALININNKVVITILCCTLFFIGFCLLYKEDASFFTFMSSHMGYDSPIIFVLSLCVFLLANKGGESKLYSVGSKLAKYTFGIYIFHPLYLM